MKTIRSIFFLCALLSMAVPTVRAQWVQTSAPISNVTGLATDGTRIFAASNTNIGAYHSSDDGGSWQARNVNLGSGLQLGIQIFGDSVFLSVLSGNGLWRMHVSDTTWIQFSGSGGGPVFVSGSLILLGNYASFAIFRSTDYGSTWTNATIHNPPLGAWVKSFVQSGSALLAGHQTGIHRSTDGGATWDSVYGGTPSPQVSVLYRHSTGVYAGGISNLFPLLLRSTNDGTTWTNITTGLPSGEMTSLTSSGSNFFCTVVGRGVYNSSNSGSSWNAVNTGLTSPNQSKLIIVKGTNAFLGTATIGLWKRPLTQLTSSESSIDGQEVPSSLDLRQNYPNPFNPRTTIGFKITSAGLVTLKVFDVTGREVAQLVHEELRAGSYESTWDASKSASGVYFYRLQTGTRTEIRKLVLLR